MSIVPLGEGLSDLIAIVRAGGVTVETALRKNSNRIACRTIIQLDGDMVVYLDPMITPHSSEWIEHLKEIETRILSITKIISRATDIARYILTLFLSILLFGFSAYQMNIWIGLGSLILSFLFHFGMERLFPKVSSRIGGSFMCFFATRINTFSGLESRAEYGNRSFAKNFKQLES